MNTDYSPHYLILGNGPAGNKAALTLRENDPQALITIVSDENIEFYYKPRLTDYIAGKIGSDRLRVNDFKFYEDRNIRLRLGQKVEKIDPVGHRVILKHMEEVGYDRLVIASGSRARLLPSMESYAEHLNFVTSFREVMEIKEKVQEAKDFFLLGGDLVGFRFLNMLRSMDKNVTMLIFPDAFWPFNLTDEMLSAIEAGVTASGTRVYSRDSVSRIRPRDRGFEITTKGGVQENADLVFSFNGLIPRVEFARGTGLDIDRGILVNEYMETSLDHIYACGSCAQIYNAGINSYTTSIGWPNAAIQGETAALNILGDHQKVESAGRKYFDLEGVQIKTSWWENIEDPPSV
ncbi:NAD(P)/FAD-dependent oxidoreductase [Desulfospira joergensenii]|uniref:NAD(P)/FAD-dependent oxidoreductase n=1 Tax=Desulfospira joergensenii TaxID=53329 RepID=UPI0003B66706|nr:FAD-dependent oxidoreductase [Desulfospira joergensenii]